MGWRGSTKLDIAGKTITKGEHEISHYVVADESGCINLSLWGYQVSY